MVFADLLLLNSTVVVRTVSENVHTGRLFYCTVLYSLLRAQYPYTPKPLCSLPYIPLAGLEVIFIKATPNSHILQGLIRNCIALNRLCTKRLSTFATSMLCGSQSMVDIPNQMRTVYEPCIVCHRANKGNFYIASLTSIHKGIAGQAETTVAVSQNRIGNFQKEQPNNRVPQHLCSCYKKLKNTRLEFKSCLSLISSAKPTLC